MITITSFSLLWIVVAACLLGIGIGAIATATIAAAHPVILEAWEKVHEHRKIVKETRQALDRLKTRQDLLNELRGILEKHAAAKKG